jgi:hypothetical protein
MNALALLMNLTSSTFECQDFESWRLEVEDVKEQYRIATTLYRRLLDEKPKGLLPRQDDPVALARHMEAEALAEYTRALKIYVELAVRGREPEDRQATARAAGGRR